MTGTNALRLEVAWFANGGEQGKPALGTPDTLAWADLTSIIADNRRIEEKDGCNLIPVRFEREPSKPRTVRRKAINARARTAIVLDIEENKATSELPPPVTDSVSRLNALRLASVVWSTHSHTAERPRYRVMVPLASEIAPNLPAVEILAARLQVAASAVSQRFDAVQARCRRLPARRAEAGGGQEARPPIAGGARDG